MTDATLPPKIDAVEPEAASDHILLEGPHSRLKELWLLMHTVVDFMRGFRTLHFVGPCVTVFGSARYGEKHPYYALGREVGHALTRIGFTVMTGGGPGLMEAANRGAVEAGGRSVGCAIMLPKEQTANRYLDAVVTCRHFFVRKVLLFKYSYAFVALPGGLGTLDELFEALTLIQTGKIQRFPVILIGTAYWKAVSELLRHLALERAIDEADLELVLITDSVPDAIAHLRKHAVDAFGLRAKAFTPSRILGEPQIAERMSPADSPAPQGDTASPRT